MVAYKIGRGPANDIVVDDSSVSRAHAELRIAEDKIVLVDLDSTNGTCVRENGRWIEIEKASVANDERILLGEVVTTVAALISRRKAPVEALGVRHMPAAERTTPGRPRADDGAAGTDDAQRMGAPLFGGEGGDHARLLGRMRRAGRNLSRAVAQPRREPGPRHEPDPPSRAAAHSAIAARVNRADGPAETPARDRARGGPRGRRNGGRAEADESPAETESPSLMVGRPPEPRPAAAPAASGGPGPPHSTPFIRVDRQVRQTPIPATDPPGPPDAAPPARRGATAGRPAGRRYAVAATVALATTACLAAAVRYGDGLGNLLDITANSRGGVIAGTPSPRADRSTVPAALTGPAAEWRRFIGGPGDDSLAAAARAPDGGHVLAGTATVGEPAHADLWAVKTDRDGQVVWRRAFGDRQSDHGLAVAAAPDGGALVAGTTENGNAGWLVRVGAKGDKLWDRKIRIGARSAATAAVALPDGGFAVLVVSRDAGADTAHTALLRLDRDGAELWRRLLHDGAVRGTDLIAVRDRGFAVAGTITGRDGSGPVLWAARLDATGEPLWERGLRRAGRDARAVLRLARRDDIILATTHRADARPGDRGALRLVRLDRDGKTLWDHLVDKAAGLQVTGMFLVKGAMIVAATADAGRRGPAAPWLARIDTDGRIEWARRFGELKGAQATTVAERRGGRILLAGHADRGETRRRDGMLLLLAPDGRPAR